MSSQVKGAVLREFLLWYERTRGEGTLTKLVAGLEPAALAPLRLDAPALGVLASAWYPSSLVHALLFRVCEGRDDEGRAIARDASAKVVPLMIHGIYAVLFRAAGSPTLYRLNVDRQWRRLHSSGKRHIRIVGPNECFSTITEWTGHHPMLCWITIYTMAHVFHAMGYEHVAVERVECVSHGGARCATVLRYR